MSIDYGLASYASSVDTTRRCPPLTNLIACDCRWLAHKDMHRYGCGLENGSAATDRGSAEFKLIPLPKTCGLRSAFGAFMILATG
jgi:hypothetical protein